MKDRQVDEEDMSYKKWKWISAILTVSLLTGCTPTPDEEEEAMRCITFYSNVKGVNSTVSFIAQSIEEQLKGKKGIQLSTYNLSAELYGLEYKVDTAIALDMDVVILNGMQSEGDTAYYQKLTQAGIPFILVDGDREDSGRCAYIGTDNLQAGRDAARAAAQQFKECQVGMISSPIQSSGGKISGSRRQRQEGFLEEAEKQQNISVAAECVCPSETLEALKNVRTLLDEHPEINVLFCADSASGIAAAKVIKERNLEEEMYVICFDMPSQVAEEIQNGVIDAAFIQDTERIGEACVAVLEELKEDRNAVQDLTIPIACKMVTQENLEEYD